jgi:hypothetical protein
VNKFAVGQTRLVSSTGYLTGTEENETAFHVSHRYWPAQKRLIGPESTFLKNPAGRKRTQFT